MGSNFLSISRSVSVMLVLIMKQLIPPFRVPLITSSKTRSKVTLESKCSKLKTEKIKREYDYSTRRGTVSLSPGSFAADLCSSFPYQLQFRPAFQPAFAAHTFDEHLIIVKKGALPHNQSK